jgi:phenylalanyl-tRNA synthetase beta subunit
VYTYSLRDKGEVEIENPLASDKNFLRDSLIPGMAQSLDLNGRFTDILGINKVALFEIGNVFVDKTEQTSVSIGLAFKDLRMGSEHKKLSNIISDLEAFLGTSTRGIGPSQETIGPSIGGIEKSSGEYEFNLDEVIESLSPPKEYDVEPEDKMFFYKPFSLFPAVLRDISVWVPSNVEEKELKKVIKKATPDKDLASNEWIVPPLIRMTLLEKYEPEDGKRVSYAFRLVFQAPNTTLTDEGVNEVMKKITNSLNSKEGFEVR